MTRHLLTVPVLALAATAFASAQVPPEGSVSGTGTAVLKRPPEVLRVHVELTAKGKDLKEALAKLAERREAARLQLAGLGAVKESIKFGETALTSEKTDRQRQMEMMVRERVRSGGKKPAKPQAEPVVVGATLKADWALAAGEPEALMLTAHALQEKVKAADLAGLKDMKLTPQEEELAEEMAALAGQFGPGGTMNDPKRGEPTFVFVAKVPEAERAKAMADAYQKARAEAARLAQAAGMELGTLRQLHHQPQAPGAEMQFPGDYEGHGYPSPYRMRGLPAGDENAPDEAVGTQPGKVTLRLTVTAAFALQQPGKAPPK